MRPRAMIFGLLVSFLSLKGSEAQFMTGLDTRQFALGSDNTFDAAMTAEMKYVEGKTLYFDSVETSRIKDAALRKHLRRFLSKPITMKLTRTPGKNLANSFKAIVTTSSGDRLRGNWKQGPDQKRLVGKEAVEMTYDDAIKRQSGTLVEYEVQLPPIKGHMPSIIYSVVLGQGSANQNACVMKSTSSVSLYPKGRGGKSFGLGKAFITFPLKGGIVDPGWAKGRTIFRNGRSFGSL